MNPYLSETERQTLASAKIGLAGTGGLGSNCAQHLVRAGIKKLVLVDDDIVSESNLNRQFFFRDQIGEKKVSALAANLRRIEPELQLELHDVRLSSANLKTIFADCDIVVECFDGAEMKAAFLKELLPTGQKLVAASGMGGFGRSNAMRAKVMGDRLVMVGDGESDIADRPPQSPRVGLAAALEANSVIALLLDKEI